MTRIRKFIQADIVALGDDEVEVTMSTDILARDGHVLLPQGCRLNNYVNNPIVLWAHDANKPIGNAENVTVDGNKITARVRFAPLGISPEADEKRGLVKAGVVRTVSVGFDPLKGEPLDPAKPKAGQRFTEWELLELSFCSVPVDTGAVVTARQLGDEPMPETLETPAAAPAAAAAAPVTRTHIGRAHGKIAFVRSVYDIGELCSIFSRLGWEFEEAKWEAAIEGDASAVPGMLAGILHDLGDAIIAMTQEEIAEALAGIDMPAETVVEEEDEALPAEARAHVRAATVPAVREFRRGVAYAMLRAGKTLSAESVRCLREAGTLHDEAIALHRSAIAKHKSACRAVDELLASAGATTDTPEGEGDAGEGDDTATTGDRSITLPLNVDAVPALAGLAPIQRALDHRRREAEALALAAR